MKVSLPKPALVKKVIQENFKTKTFITDQETRAKPGQFFMLWIPGQVERPFSATDDQPLTFTIMSVGPFTIYFNHQIKKGDKIWYRGPFGKGIFREVKGKKILVAGGCGCVPLYFFTKTIRSKKTTTVIVGAKTKKELLFDKRFKELGFKVISVTDDGSFATKGLTTDVLEKILEKEKFACVYGCGPDTMLKKISQICNQYQTKFQLSLEALMKCGFGVCGSCSRGGKLVCQDGPVFSKWPGERR